MKQQPTTTVRWGDDGSVTVETPRRLEVMSNFAGGRTMLIIVLLAVGFATANFLYRSGIVIASLAESFDLGTAVVVLGVTAALVGLLIWLWRFMTRGHSVVVADAKGIAYGMRSKPQGTALVVQRPSWGEVRDIRVEDRGSAKRLVYVSNYGDTPFGLGLQADEAARVAQSMLELRAAARQV